ncbi:DNA (cytosine-5)-methyltransferase 1 [Tessaracoccus bendigoensis DSM 12906]|uniref:DNA (cytosine-5-)-methyltransferase n=1 Tax=Tessaracoccus bendigoensis DSM 12906 TaxID=1123357 RepID=A0A1M6LHM0_9ACTN|nr:DNA cytosine methyltransferase [Tessaracoccus bendigoensis]SHJ70658.1 DNA (cytosine-5)-methyltransferase 1 [Tessaracoccus bendigoensis DSM 12906]
MHDLDVSSEPRLRIGSLFSGYGGLDLAVEHVFNAKTVWFSELNQPVARVFSHHWPDAPNLGDITAIDWSHVEPVDILIGGFPCQDVSTVGKRAGLAPGTRSGLWAHMAAAIDALQPEWVVIENVRGLLSSPATRPPAEGDDHDRRNPSDATPDGATLRGVEPDPWHLGDKAARPLRALGAVLGDLADLRLDARWIGLPASLVGAPHQRFRIFALARRTVPHPAGDGLIARRGNARPSASETRDDRIVPPDHRLRTPRTGWLTEQESRVGNAVVPDRRTVQRWGRYADTITRWEHITGRAAPAPALLNDADGPRPAPAFVEWLMGLPTEWVTGADDLTQNQQITALGNGVLPLQACAALSSILAQVDRIDGGP